MSNEQDIIAACVMDRGAFESFQLYASANELTPLGQHWLSHVSDYYDRDDSARKCELGILPRTRVAICKP